MTWAGSLRRRLYAAKLERCEGERADEPGPEARAAIQLELLNQEWLRVVSVCPYYADMQRTRALPREFGSLEEFAARVPPTLRDTVQVHGGQMISRGRPPDAVKATGGSTSKPIRIPVWRGEDSEVRFNQWQGRSWYGVDPGSTLVQLWGHSHLLGTGSAGWLRARRLELSDWLLGYRRFSAYDLRPEVLRQTADRLVALRPDYVIGYSVALDLFAQANADRRDRLREAGVRVVIATAESFPSRESAPRLADLFGCPVGMEYGAVEMGVVAHTHPEGGYRCFWRNTLLEAVGKGSRRRILVTSLYPRCFPLIRYEVGDELEASNPSDPSLGLVRFERMIGRSNDYVPLSGGAMIHSEAFSHALRIFPVIRAFQVMVGGDQIEVRYVADGDLSCEDASRIHERMRRVHAGLEGVALRRVPALEQTVAGKTRMVVHR